MTTRRVSAETRARRATAEVKRVSEAMARAERLYHDKNGELNVVREAAIREQAARDPESVAIDACVKALDIMTRPDTSNNTLVPTVRFAQPWDMRVVETPLSRVLAYLHERYVGPRPTEADLTRQLAEATERVRELEQRLDSVRCQLG